MKKIQKDILKLKKFDALDFAERVTGESYKTDKQTEALGFMLHIQKGQEMRDILSKADDTQFSNTVTEYLRITGNFGFEVVYQEPFMTERGEENLYVLFHKELGIIIEFDTFSWEGKEANVNGGNMYYNWSPNSFDMRGSLTSSGHYLFAKKGSHMTLFEKDLSTKYEIPNYPESAKWDTGSMTYEEFKSIDTPICKEQKELFQLALDCGKRFLWIGGHDCREGIITTIKSLFENGKFFPVWQDCPFPWITNYMEHKNKDCKYPFDEYYELTEKRISRMPKEVQDCINNTYRKNQQP